MLFNEIKIKGKIVDCASSLEKQVLKRLRDEFFIERNEFYERCLARTEKQIFPKPVKHKKQPNKMTKKHINLSNKTKSIRDKTSNKVASIGRSAAAVSTIVGSASGSRVVDEVQMRR